MTLLRRIIILIVQWWRPPAVVPAAPEEPVELLAAEPLAMPAPEIGAAALEVRRVKKPKRERDKWFKPVRAPRQRNLNLRPRGPKRTVLHAVEMQQDDDILTDQTKWRFDPYGEDTGVFYFRGALLDRLDDYMRTVRRMRRVDSDAYDLYSRIGGVIVPHAALASDRSLPSFWKERKQRPAFGCLSFARSLEERKTCDGMLHLMYFTKLSRPPPAVEPCPEGSDVYYIGCYFDDYEEQMEAATKVKKYRVPKWLRKHGFHLGFHVAIMSSGQVKLLKELQTKYRHIDYRASDGSLSNTGQPSSRVRWYTHDIPYSCWEYPEHVNWWWADKDSLRHQSLEEWAASFLPLIANFSQAQDYAIRINVTNEINEAIVFCVEWKRTSYFFRDRDQVLNAKGKPARIFHIVKPHPRTLADGRRLDIKMHFRGLRRFQWGKYRVHITVPGLHHITMAEFTVGADDLEAIPPDQRKGLIAMGGLGRQLAKHIDGIPLSEIFR